MKSKVAVVVSLAFVLVIGGAALAVNTRILDTSPPSDIGRANELLIPGGATPALPPTATPAVVTAPTPTAPTPTAPTSIASPRSDDEHRAGEHSEDEGEHDRDD